MTDISRRNFLKSTSALSLGTAAGFATNLASFNAFAAETSGYKAMVCLFLFGGMDCHDTILPYDQTSYDSMATIRQSLFSQYAAQQGGSSRARDRLLPLNALNESDQGGLLFAMPEQLAPLHELFANGNAAVVGNVGPLIEPTTRDQFQQRSVQLPARLFSHNDQQSTWMASEPEGAQFGWGGRVGDLMLAANANSRATFTAVSAAGNAVFLSGNDVQQMQVNTNGANSINGVDANALYGSQEVADIYSDQLTDVNDTLSNLFERDFASVTRRSIEANRDLRTALETAPPLATTFPDNHLARQLNIVARMIGVRASLGVSRQVFFVSTGGYDTHSNQAASLPNLHTGLAGAVRAFPRLDGGTGRLQRGDALYGLGFRPDVARQWRRDGSWLGRAPFCCRRRCARHAALW